MFYVGKYEDMLIEHDYIEVIECDKLPNDLYGFMAWGYDFN